MSVFLNWLIDFVYPVKCVVCGTTDVFLCGECLKDLEYSEQICPECGEESVMGWSHEKCKKKYGLDGLIAVYAYQDEKVRKIIDEIKFGFNRDLIKILVESMEIQLGIELDSIVPIPLYFYRENWRGFNQAEEIARLLGNQLEAELLAIKKIRGTKQQSLSKNKEEREKNVKDAFVLIDKEVVRGKKVILVDDIFTSGASMKEACKVLKEAGASLVWGLTLAH